MMQYKNWQQRTDLVTLQPVGQFLPKLIKTAVIACVSLSQLSGAKHGLQKLLKNSTPLFHNVHGMQLFACT